MNCKRMRVRERERERLGTYPCRVGRFHSFVGDSPGGGGGDKSFS